MAAALLALSALGNQPARAQDTPPRPELVTRGEYVAQAADCAACHTMPGGAPFAGGLAFHLPTGTLYAPNITPDAQAGIGGYSEAEFIRAVRNGIRRDGATLYPAMPYPSYARMTDDDLHALYAYFMQGVRPVATPVVQDGMHWPLSMRWPLTVWRRLFAPDPAVTLKGLRPALSLTRWWRAGLIWSRGRAIVAPVTRRAP
ncbi:c-type cytochrome [Komagataeibacter nataicola]|uniref:c-type cytochrome n=1 Tax=Komagataeibacter nataicola TaxID=265960 RepID=UPI0028B1C09B|nr:c-type cytochrome [Komagataeibacter nataicola]